MSLKSAITSLLQVTNIVLMLRNSSPDIRKFVVWRVDKSDPQEVLNRLEIESATFNDGLKIFEHPLETGAVITDHVIKDPNEALIQAYIAEDDADTLKELEYLYINAIPLKLRVENTVIERAIIKDKPFKLDAAHFDKTAYSITFREEQEVSPVYTSMPARKVQKKANASRVNSGVKQAKRTSVSSSKKASWAYSLVHGGRT